MGDMLIRNISDALRADIENLARKNGQSVTETAREIMRIGVDAAMRRNAEFIEMPPGQKLLCLAKGASESDAEFDEFRQIMDGIRHGADRPLPEFK
ncbi:hypothetical protein [Mesorhizobium xinjiangense]|uniref:hypothetical protein n=1 Tax=Mesorhizobium xinjiangense TaxID=2678685 RepID=UPI0012EDFD49|nr:hypothetical protein [Mesorhizobium xinjiangense]